MVRYRAYIARRRTNFDARVALAALMTRMQAPSQEVTALLVDATKADPTNALIQEALIRRYLREGRQREALAEAQRAPGLLPSSIALLGLLGEAQRAEEDHGQAVQTLRRVVVARPRVAEALARPADAQARKGDVAGAKESLTQALRLAPE